MASEVTRDDEKTRRLQSAQRATAPQIQTAVAPMEPGVRSSDPYNTSGSFDRSRNWARVGKR